MHIQMAIVAFQAETSQAMASLRSFAELHPIAAGLCAFALVAVVAAGIRAQIRRSAKREAWHMIVEDRKVARRGDAPKGATYSDAIDRQLRAD